MCGGAQLLAGTGLSTVATLVAKVDGPELSSRSGFRQDAVDLTHRRLESLFHPHGEELLERLK